MHPDANTLWRGPRWALALLLAALCLGAQNLNQRSSVNLGFGRTAELPTGFLVGVALVIGVISGGTATALLLPGRRRD